MNRIAIMANYYIHYRTSKPKKVDNLYYAMNFIIDCITKCKNAEPKHTEETPQNPLINLTIPEELKKT